MKFKYILILLFSGVLLFSCGKGKEDSAMNKIKNATKAAKSASKSINNARKLGSQSEEMQLVREKLAKKEPASSTEMKSILPENLNGWERESFEVKSNPVFEGLKTAKAKYENDDGTITVEIVDGAGETASSLIFGAMWTLRSEIDDLSDAGFRKSKKKDGNYMNVKQQKNGDRTDSEIISSHFDRFLVTLKGQNVTVKELEKAYDELDFKAFK